ncbi:uncharacterized protein FIBRA_03151 [Fibroporia radiculosa]|uniref:Uncharacterized protein n=1 Tax=Fibroporia radiculosa TaxID=599839 RepID=J4G4C4_9APHY|nr:uncharacterized protein FIBRA_03151 [Fibroporia radiculosa]CCM01103.1 predicted protein [Fibroporia radiculosa]
MAETKLDGIYTIVNIEYENRVKLPNDNREEQLACIIPDAAQVSCGEKWQFTASTKGRHVIKSDAYCSYIAAKYPFDTDSSVIGNEGKAWWYIEKAEKFGPYAYTYVIVTSAHGYYKRMRQYTSMAIPNPDLGSSNIGFDSSKIYLKPVAQNRRNVWKIVPYPAPKEVEQHDPNHNECEQHIHKSDAGFENQTTSDCIDGTNDHRLQQRVHAQQSPDHPDTRFPASRGFDMSSSRPKHSDTPSDRRNQQHRDEEAVPNTRGAWSSEWSRRPHGEVTDTSPPWASENPRSQSQTRMVEDEDNMTFSSGRLDPSIRRAGSFTNQQYGHGSIKSPDAHIHRQAHASERPAPLSPWMDDVEAGPDYRRPMRSNGDNEHTRLNRFAEGVPARGQTFPQPGHNTTNMTSRRDYASGRSTPLHNDAFILQTGLETLYRSTGDTAFGAPRPRAESPAPLFQIAGRPNASAPSSNAHLGLCKELDNIFFLAATRANCARPHIQVPQQPSRLKELRSGSPGRRDIEKVLQAQLFELIVVINTPEKIRGTELAAYAECHRKKAIKFGQIDSACKVDKGDDIVVFVRVELTPKKPLLLFKNIEIDRKETVKAQGNILQQALHLVPMGHVEDTDRYIHKKVILRTFP